MELRYLPPGAEGAGQSGAVVEVEKLGMVTGSGSGVGK
jgi:hypothetical protein